MTADINCPCGYLVVTLPQFDEIHRNGRGHPVECEGAHYHGIDRTRWSDLFAMFFSGKLPSHVKELLGRMRSDSRDFTGLTLCYNFEAALELLNYANRDGRRCELLVVGSKKLQEIKNHCVDVSAPLTPLGYDVVSLGNWSLIGSGVFVDAESFPISRKFINHFGLASSSDLKINLDKEYKIAAERGKVEELPDSPYGLDVIHIGRIELEEL